MNRLVALKLAAPVLFLLLAAVPMPAGQDGEDLRSGRFNLEFSAGGQALDPASLNLAVDTEDRIQALHYDHYLEALRQSGQIISWSAAASGRRGRVSGGWLIQPRLRYGLGSSLALSLALRVQRGGSSRDLQFEFTRVLPAGDRYVETLAFSPASLNVHSYWPSLGIHWRRRLGRHFSAEAHAAAGPLFAGISLASAWTYAWDMRGSDYTWPVFRDAGERSEKGSGTGIGLELGARIGLRLGRRLEAFLESGYAWQRANSLSGSGQETRAGRQETWSGGWVTRSETIVTPWETIVVTFPTNRPLEGADDSAFRLDLSGWQLRLGVSWRL